MVQFFFDNYITSAYPLSQKKTFVSEGVILVRNISIIIFWNVLAFQLYRKSLSVKITCNPNNTIAKKRIIFASTLTVLS